MEATLDPVQAFLLGVDNKSKRVQVRGPRVALTQVEPGSY